MWIRWTHIGARWAYSCSGLTEFTQTLILSRYFLLTAHYSSYTCMHYLISFPYWHNCSSEFRCFFCRFCLLQHAIFLLVLLDSHFSCSGTLTSLIKWGWIPHKIVSCYSKEYEQKSSWEFIFALLVLCITSFKCLTPSPI